MGFRAVPCGNVPSPIRFAEVSSGKIMFYDARGCVVSELDCRTLVISGGENDTAESLTIGNTSVDVSCVGGKRISAEI